MMTVDTSSQVAAQGGTQACLFNPLGVGSSLRGSTRILPWPEGLLPGDGTRCFFLHGDCRRNLGSSEEAVTGLWINRHGLFAAPEDQAS